MFTLELLGIPGTRLSRKYFCLKVSHIPTMFLDAVKLPCMATKPPTYLSELMTIRDILMGEIIHEYNERFEKVEADLQAQREALNAKEAALDERIKALDALLQQKSNDLSTHFTDKIEEDRQSLSALFLSLGQELKR